MICKKCGSEVAEDDVFCMQFCGAKTDGTEPAKPQITVSKPQTATEQSTPRYEKRPDTDTKGAWAIGAAIILVAIIAIACLGMGMDGTEEDGVAEDGYLTDETYDDDKDFAWLNEDFDDYLGNWFSMDASTPSVVLYSTAEITYIDEDLGVASGESEDEYYYLSAVFDFMDGAMIVSTQIIEKTSDYDLELEDLECQPWTEADEAVLNEYIFPESHFQYLKEWELEGLSKEELKIARNEIYARHGRMFQDDSLQAYFNSCSWYTPSIAPEDFKESMLNEVEIANRDLIVSYEKEMGYQ